MILIADSGSTKCDWILLDEEGSEVDRTLTMGFNPYFHSEATIATAIKQNEKLGEYDTEISRVFYYGAGCSSQDLKKTVWRAIRQRFSRADILIEHDLLGAAYATYDGQPHISCILGTGSNSCFFDGVHLTEKVPALGYILGDEGSGSYFGKKLIAAYLYKQLPPKVQNAFYEQFKLDMKDIVENVYGRPHANVYLASFVRFISGYKDEPIFKEMLHEGMKHFLENHVACFDNHKDVPVSFVGSVAYHFQDSIRSAADEMGITIGRMVQRPLDRLKEYHVHYILEKSNK